MMDYELNIDEDNKIVVFTVEGVVNAEAALLLSEEGTRVARPKNIKSWIFDLRKAEIKETNSNILKFVTDFKKRGIQPNECSAILYSNSDFAFKLFEVFSLNYGYGIRCFKDYDKAVEWLIKQQSIEHYDD